RNHFCFPHCIIKRTLCSPFLRIPYQYDIAVPCLIPLSFHILPLSVVSYDFLKSHSPPLLLYDTKRLRAAQSFCSPYPSFRSGRAVCVPPAVSAREVIQDTSGTVRITPSVPDTPWMISIPMEYIFST